jgi:hypothetical protein
MSVKQFDKMFGLSSSIEEEKIRFVNRIENAIFNWFINNYEFDEYRQLFKLVCYDLGLDAQELIEQNSFMRTSIPNFKTLTKKDFVQTLRIIVSVYNNISEKPYEKQFISTVVVDALEKAHINLGVKWADGVFYPTGDKLLDKELIDTAVSLLDKYPNEKKDLKNALDNYNSNSLYGVVENCYIAVEGISRQILSNKKTLDNNKEELLRLLQFSKYWDKIFLNYLSYAHEYRRHAGERRHELKAEEVEGFLYLSCLIIRSTLRAYDESKKAP